MKKKPKIVVVTGAESTGKSELTRKLAHHFSAPFVPEYAREYVEHLNREYTFADVEKIAQKQIDDLVLLKETDNKFVFIDTWLIITQTWFEVVFKRVPDWLEQEIKKTKIDFFLVCDIDLPWIPDPVRENGGEKRILLQEKYIEMIEKYKFNFGIVSGKNDSRFLNALKYISHLNKNKPC